MKYDLAGINGNAFCIMCYVIDAMQDCRFSKDAQHDYYKDATSGDYDHLLMVSVAMIDKCNEFAGCYDNYYL
jgi:hypothetical protein